MFFNQNKNLFFLEPITSPKHVVFCDLDETYLALENTHRQKKWLRSLEEFLLNNCQRLELLFGFVTGSNISTVYSKIQEYGLSVMPHFVASSLGTELTYFDGNNKIGSLDQNWERNLSNSGYEEKHLAHLLEDLKKNDRIILDSQTLLDNSKYKRSYYYYVVQSQDVYKDLEKTCDRARKYGINVNISRCNPLVGDPSNAYDVDFIPKIAGKSQIVKYLLSVKNIRRENSFAFGDSGNDIEMLKTVKYGYLVANATEEAKTMYEYVLKEPYAEGILKTIVVHFNDKNNWSVGA